MQRHLRRPSAHEPDRFELLDPPFGVGPDEVSVEGVAVVVDVKGAKTAVCGGVGLPSRQVVGEYLAKDGVAAERRDVCEEYPAGDQARPESLDVSTQSIWIQVLEDIEAEHSVEVMAEVDCQKIASVNVVPYSVG